MSQVLSVAASLSPTVRQDISIQVLSRAQPISHLASTHQVSRKFIYQQGDKAQRSLDEAFVPSTDDEDVLFYLPVTKSWLYQLILGLVLICHSSYRIARTEAWWNSLATYSTCRSAWALSITGLQQQPQKPLKSTSHKTFPGLEWAYTTRFSSQIAQC